MRVCQNEIGRSSNLQIIRKKNGLQGQQISAQGNALGYILAGRYSDCKL